MKFRIQTKLILITVATALIACVIGAFVAFYHFSQFYKRNISERIFAQAQGLKTIIEDVVDLGLDLGELRGLSQECYRLVENVAYAQYCFVTDLSGKVFYHSNLKERQKFYDDISTQRSLVSEQNLVQSYQDDQGRTIYDFSIPILGSEGQRIGVIRIGTLSNIIYDDIAKVRNLFLWLALFLIFISSVMVYFLSEKTILRPIGKLVDGATRVGRGDLDQLIDIETKDEIGELAHAFNAMILNLKKITASRNELNREVDYRIKVENALRAEKDRAQQYLDVAGVIILALNNTGDVVLINDQGCEILGYAKEEIMGKNWFSYFLPNKFVSQVKEVHSRIMLGEVDLLKYYENPILTKKGEEKIILWNNCLLKDEQGEIIGVLSSGEDVTERRRSEKVMLLQRDFGIALSTIHNTKEAADTLLNFALKIEGLDSGSVYLVEDPTKDLCLVSYRGFTAEEIQGKIKYFFDSQQAKAVFAGKVIYKAQGEVHPEYDFYVLQEGPRAIATIPIQDRGKIIAVLNLSSFMYEQIPLRIRHWLEVFSSIFGGVAARLKAEEEAHKNEEKYRELVQNANSIILRMDEQGKVIFFNEYAQRFFGYGGQEILGQNVLGTIVPLREDGGRDLSEIIHGICDVPEEFAYNENQNICKDGRKVWVAWTNKAVLNEKGKREILCIGTDISKRKEAERQLEDMYLDLQRMNDELREAQNQILQSEKMAAIGQLSAGVAHEIKNPLAIVLLGTNILIKKIDQFDEQSREQLEMIRNAAERANRVVAELLSFSRDTKIHLEKISIQEILDDSVILAQSAFSREKILFKKEYPTSSLDLMADKMLLEQVFFNLFSNAADAIEDRGTISIKVSLGRGSKPSQKKIIVQVVDDGQGMAPEVVQRVFEPFFTTKEEGKGSGLGLSICYMILQRHNAEIVVQSESGKGTKVTISFPLKV